MKSPLALAMLLLRVSIRPTLLSWVLQATVTLTLSAAEPVWLDQLSFGLIADPHGPPKRAQSFNLEPLRMAGTNFTHGLGVHAPSDLRVALGGQAEAFEAVVGLDPRPVQVPDAGTIVALPQVGGLHHRYERRAA